MNTKQDQPTAQTPIACSLSDPELARRAAELERDLFSAVAEVQELPDGYAYRFPAEQAWIDKLTQFIVFERECCPFFTFELVFEPTQGPVWLRLRGSGEIKAFVAAQFTTRVEQLRDADGRSEAPSPHHHPEDR